MKGRSIYFLLILLILIVDQSTKTLIVKTISPFSVKEVIPGFFNLVFVRNTGAIFGFFSNSGSLIIRIMLPLATLTALGLVIYFFIKTELSEKLVLFSLSLIIAGALGNFTDRIFRGYVVDFLHFYIKNLHWPSFNAADSCITVGAAILIFTFFFRRSPKCTPSS